MEEPIVKNEQSNQDLNKLLEQYQKEAEDYAKELLQIRKSSQNSLLERVKTEKLSGASSSSSVVLVGSKSKEPNPDIPHSNNNKDLTLGASVTTLPLSSNNSSISISSSQNKSPAPFVDAQSSIASSKSSSTQKLQERVFSVSVQPRSSSQLSLHRGDRSQSTVQLEELEGLRPSGSVTTVLNDGDSKNSIQVRQSINNLAYSLDKSVQKSLETLTNKVEKALVQSSRSNLNAIDSNTPLGEITTVSKTVTRNSNANLSNGSPKTKAGGNIDYEEETITITASPHKKSSGSQHGLNGTASVKKTEISVNEHHHHHHQLPEKNNTAVFIQQPTPIPVPSVSPNNQYVFVDRPNPVPQNPSPELLELKERFRRQEQDYLSSIKSLTDNNQFLNGQMHMLQDGLSCRDRDIKALQDQIDLLQKTMKMNFDVVNAKDKIISNTTEAAVDDNEDTDELYEDDLYFTALASRRDSHPEVTDEISSAIRNLTETMDMITSPARNFKPANSAPTDSSHVVDIGAESSVVSSAGSKGQKANETLIKAIEDETKVLILHYRQLQDELSHAKDHARRLETKHADEVLYLQGQLQKQQESARDMEKERNQYLNFLEEYGRQYTIFEPGSEAIHPLPFHKHWQDIKGRIDTLHEAMAKQATQLSFKDRILEEKDHTIMSLKKHSNSQDKKMKKLESEVISKLQREIGQRDRALQSQERHIQDLNKQITALTATKDHLEEAINRINESYSVIFQSTGGSYDTIEH